MKDTIRNNRAEALEHDFDPPMYLVQRIKFMENIAPNAPTPLGKHLKFDYIGAAEFEDGSVQLSLARIAKMYSEGNIVCLSTKWKNMNDVPLNIVCYKYDVDGVINTIKEYIDDASITSQIRKYRTKEWLGLEYHLVRWYEVRTKEKWNRGYLDHNCWMDVQNDFFFFMGAADRRRIFMDALDKHVKMMKEKHMFPFDE